MKITGKFKKFQPLEDDTVSILVSVPKELVDESMLTTAAKFYRKDIEISLVPVEAEPAPDDPKQMKLYELALAYSRHKELMNNVVQEMHDRLFILTKGKDSLAAMESFEEPLPGMEDEG